MRATAVRSCSPQSQRKLPKRSPVRHAECNRTGTAVAGSGLPMTTATCSPRLCSSRNTAISHSSGVGERHASARQKLQSVVAEARRVMHDVADRDRQHARQRSAVCIEPDERRHEPARLRELERSRRERRVWRHRIDVERRRVDGSACRLLQPARATPRDRWPRETPPTRRRSIGATSRPRARARR